jgi:hypothetical protein
MRLIYSRKKDRTIQRTPLLQKDSLQLLVQQGGCANLSINVSTHPDEASFLPEDILERINNDFRKKRENRYVKNKLLTLYTKNINVGAEQLMRSILATANGKKCILDKIFDENFYNDSRDVFNDGDGNR